MIHRILDPQHVPDLILEQYRLGELSEAEKEQFRRRLQTDPELRLRLAALELSDQEILHRYPAGWLASRVRHRLQANGHTSPPVIARRIPAWRLALAAAAAMVVIGVGWQWIGPGFLPSPWWTTDSIEPTDRIKGDALTLFRKKANGSEVLSDGDRVRAGDQLRIGYRAGGRTFGMILSIDGRGVVTSHLPQKGDRAARLAPQGQVLLDYAYELDDAPGWERFYLVTGLQEFDTAPVLAAARAAAAKATSQPPESLSLDPALDQSSIVLLKETTP